MYAVAWPRLKSAHQKPTLDEPKRMNNRWFRWFLLLLYALFVDSISLLICIQTENALVDGCPFLISAFFSTVLMGSLYFMQNVNSWRTVFFFSSLNQAPNQRILFNFDKINGWQRETDRQRERIQRHYVSKILIKCNAIFFYVNKPICLSISFFRSAVSPHIDDDDISKLRMFCNNANDLTVIDAFLILR